MEVPEKLRKKKRFSIRKRAESFAFAFSGMEVLLRSQHNARIHILAAFAALSLGVWLEIGTVRLCLILLSIVLVLVAEALNTAVEMMIDMATAQRTWPAKWAKDVAAAAVLFASLGAAAAGLLILGPPLYERLESWL